MPAAAVAAPWGEPAMIDARHGPARIAAAALALAAAGCGAAPERAAQAPSALPAPTAAPAPTGTPIPLDAPALQLVQGEAEVTSGGRPLPEVPGALGVGDALALGEEGLAVLRWEPGLRAELLSGARARLEAPEADRTARVEQSAGVARYTVAASAAGAALDVAAGAVRLRADGPADVIVGFDPDAAGATWVYVVDGDVALADRAGADAIASSAATAGGAADRASGPAARLAAGHAVVFTPGGPQPVALPVDLPAVEVWYAGALDGAGPSIARASFRCVVRAGAVAALRAQPPIASAEPGEGGGELVGAAVAAPDRSDTAGETLAPGALVEVAARDEAGEWLQVTVVPAGGLRPRAVGAVVGWLPAGDLDCVGPTDGLVVVDPGADPAEPVAPVADAAPRSAPTAGPAVFAADRTSLVAGDCALISWDVPVGTAVALNGRPVAGKGVERACPESASSYRLTWLDARGGRQERVVQLAVAPAGEGPVAGAEGGDDRRGRAAAPEPTPCETECVVELPTLAPEPTRRPRPTATVRPAPSSPPPAPTAAPQPTAARPDPTERPPETPDPGPGDPTHTPDPGATEEPSPSATPEVPGTPTDPPVPGTPTPDPGTASPEPGPSPTPAPSTTTPSPTPTTEP